MRGFFSRKLLAGLIILISAILLFFLDPQLMIVPLFLLVKIFSSKSKSLREEVSSSSVKLSKEFMFLTIIGFLAGECLELFAVENYSFVLFY